MACWRDSSPGTNTQRNGQKVEWDVYIPEGTATIMLLDTPQIIPLIRSKIRENNT